MNRDEILKQARVGGWAKTAIGWVPIVEVNPHDPDRPLCVKMPTYPRWPIPVDRVAAIRPPDDALAQTVSDKPANDGPTQTMIDKPAAPSLFDLAEQVARWPLRDPAHHNVATFVEAARRLLELRDGKIEAKNDADRFLRDGGAL